VKIGQVTNKTGHFIQKQRQELGFPHQQKDGNTRQQAARVVGVLEKLMDGDGANNLLVFSFLGTWGS